MGGSYVFVDGGDDDGLPHLVTYLGDVVPETYQAYGDLGDFEGGDARGNWYLDVRNMGGSDVSLISWELTLHYKEYE